MIYYTYNGQCRNITDWCKQLNLNYDRVYSRLRNKLSFEEAIKPEKRRYRSFYKLYEYNGKSQTIDKWGEEYNIDYNILRNRLLSKNWTMEEALTAPKRFRKHYKTEMLDSYGKLTVLEFDHRDANHYDFYKCLCECGRTKVIMGQNLRTGKTKGCGECYKILLTYNGITQSIGKWAKELNIPPSTIRRRLRQGYSAENALTKKDFRK